mgnify:CR=1 FL=1
MKKLILAEKYKDKGEAARDILRRAELVRLRREVIEEVKDKRITLEEFNATRKQVSKKLLKKLLNG